MDGRSASVLSFLPPFETGFGLNAGPMFHVSAAGVTVFGICLRMFGLLVDDEEPEELRRELSHRLVCFLHRKVMAEERVLVAGGIISGYEFQVALHDLCFFSFLGNRPEPVPLVAKVN